jgi:hypothetical protein
VAKSVQELFDKVLADPKGAWFSGVAVASSDIEELPRVVGIETGLVRSWDGKSASYSDAMFNSISDGPGDSRGAHCLT